LSITSWTVASPESEIRVQLGQLWLLEQVRNREEVADDVAVGAV